MVNLLSKIFKGRKTHTRWETRKKNGSLGRTRHRWQDNMKTDLTEIQWESVDSTDVTHESEKWWVFCEHSNEHLGSIKFNKFLN